jgi:F-type H+-transporting ATPase subunit delta
MSADIDFYKYAWALSKISKDIKELEEIQQNLKGLKQILEEKQDVFKLLKHPGVPQVEKFKIIESIAKELKFSKTASEFIKLIVGDGIVEHLEDILNKYSAILRAINKEIKVKIQTAHSQDRKTLDEIKEVLSKKFGRKIVLEFSENKDLIGGFRIIADGQAFDCSVKGELEQIREILK